MLASSQFVKFVLKKDSLAKENRSLENENNSLYRQNRSLKYGVIGLAVFGALLSGYTCKTVSDLKKARSENKSLSADVTSLRGKEFDLLLENQNLKPYKDFVDSIEPFYPDVMDSATEEEQRALDVQNIKAQEQWSDACEILGINPEQLFQLKNLSR